MCERCATFPNSLEFSGKRHLVALVSSDPERFVSWRRCFRDFGVDVTNVSESAEGADMVRVFSSKPDLVIFDDASYKGGVFEKVVSREIPYVVAGKHGKLAVDVISGGAEHFIALPVNPRVALAHLRAILARVHSFQSLALNC